MKKIFLILNILLIVALTACSGNPPPAPPIALTPHPSAPPDDPIYTTKCATIYSSVPDDVKLPGAAVLDDYKFTAHLFLKNLQTGSEIALATPNDTVSDIRVSPDQKSVGYQLGDPKTGEWGLVVANVQGQRISETIWQQGFFILGKWANNESILMLSNPPFVIFNPYNQQQIGYDFADFPGYAHDANTNRIIEIDSTLERAAYKNTNDKVSIYDIPNKKVLAEVDNSPNPTIMAQWAPDGSKVAVNASLAMPDQPTEHSEDVFLVTRDGRVSRTTHLTDHFGKLVSLSKAGISWSPDNTKLAFWIAYPQNGYQNWELIVHDTVTEKSTNYCILNEYENELNATHYLLPPAWSPDSKFLLTENRYNKTDSRTLILNLETAAAYQIEENKFPAGWIVP